MRPISFPVTILRLAELVPPTFGAAGDWPMWRHDPALTGYQPTPGGMTKEFRIPAPERTDSRLAEPPTEAVLIRAEQQRDLVALREEVGRDAVELIADALQNLCEAVDD